MPTIPILWPGHLDADSCDKITSFLVLCDSYNIPIVMLVDTPDFLIGKAGEYKKVTGKIINWMNALSLVTVPIVTVIIRKTSSIAEILPIKAMILWDVPHPSQLEK